MAQMLPSGKQATYMNRIGRAKTYLVKAGASGKSSNAAPFE